MDFEDTKDKIKEMYQQWKLGLLNEHETNEMRDLALQYFIEKNWEVID